MSRSLLTVAADESVLMTYELVRRAGVHHAPVMTGDGHCLGVVSIQSLEANASLSWESPQRTVSQLVGTPVTVPPTATVAEAAETMQRSDVDAVLVVDMEQLVGLVSWRDLVSYVAGTTRPDHNASHSHPVLFSLQPVIELADRQ
jgi:CBS domain-containing protein